MNRSCQRVSGGENVPKTESQYFPKGLKKKPNGSTETVVSVLTGKSRYLKGISTSRKPVKFSNLSRFARHIAAYAQKQDDVGAKHRCLM